MINIFFQSRRIPWSIFSGFLIVSLLISLIPHSVLADLDDAEASESNTTATSSDTGADSGTNSNILTSDNTTASSTSGDTGTTTASSTPDNTVSTTTASSTPENPQPTDTSTTTASSTPSAQNGQSGTDGTTGAVGLVGNSISENLSDTHNPVATSSDALLGDDTENASDEPDQNDENITGEILVDGGNITIETAKATAKAEIFTDANSNDVRSELTSEAAIDLDFYTFNATGTNSGVALNEGESIAVTGGNTAEAVNSASIITDDAIAVINVANIINTSVVNSDGIIYLGNKILNDGESLDLTNNFFPDTNKHLLSTNVCNLMSCAAEDVVYNFSQQNTATITNDINIEASTGKNVADGYNTISNIVTGRAFANANVMNVANTNIIDSNYQLLTFNAIGDLDGDLILPTEDLFMAYFAQPNGTNQVEQAEEAVLAVDNINIADDISNNLNTYGETGDNQAATSYDSTINTGLAYTESNILNKINENSFGGDIFELRIRIHGNWDGEVVDLPAGLSWEYTDDGIRIYNQNAEIATSPNIGYDIDSYRANIANHNDIVLHNDLNLSAVSGQNRVSGWYGNIETGDAYASANVMNVANTNIIGVNWTYALVNILGDLKGNISFSAPTDLVLSGTVALDTNTLTPSSTLTYSYTVTNNSTVPAIDVSVEQNLAGDSVEATQTNQSKSLGNIEAHGTRQVVFSAAINPALSVGTSSFLAITTVRSQTSDTNFSDNSITIQNDFHYSTSTTNDSTAGTEETEDGDSNTPVDNEVIIIPPSSGGMSVGGGGGGGGGGGSKYSKKNVEREEVAVDPNKPPLITITKTAKVGRSKIIRAGDSIDYTIVVKNKGGQAYNATVYDVLSNPIGAELNKQDWYLGTIKAGEEIKLTYTTEYDPYTPSGIYTNTASIVAYAKPSKLKTRGSPLKIRNAVYELKINGVPLVVGNVGVLAFFPSGSGQVSALLSWETSTSSISQIVYGPLLPVSSYTPGALNYGYQNASVRFPTAKTRHFMIITGLKSGQSYAYRANAITSKNTIVSREHAFRVPSFVPSLTLASASDNLLLPTPKVAGASTLASSTYSYKPSN